MSDTEVKEVETVEEQINECNPTRYKKTCYSAEPSPLSNEAEDLGVQLSVLMTQEKAK